MCPQLGTWPTTQAHAETGNWNRDSGFVGWHPTHGATQARAVLNSLKKFFKKILFIYFFLREGKEKERGRNINVWLPLMYPLLWTWPATQACARTGNQTSYPLVRSPVLSPLSYTSQGLFLILYQPPGMLCSWDGVGKLGWTEQDFLGLFRSSLILRNWV